MSDLPQPLLEALADRYRIVRELGRGGFAVVYLADDLRHSRQVAIKVLEPEAGTALEASRFHREIRMAAGLQHPHILPVHDSGEAAGHLYYVMPYVPGATLRQRLDREGRLDAREATRLVAEVADGLAEAHSRGLIHRDIKPENILMSGDHAVLADFGIARPAPEGPETRLTRTGYILGTSAYMSPEQWAGEDVDGRADQYSLACVLYEALAGEPPFSAASPRALFAAHMADPVPSLAGSDVDVPAAVDRAIGRATAKDPADRFDDIRDFASALTGGEVAEAGKPKRGLPPLRLPGRAPGVVGWIAAALLLAVAAYGGLTRLGSSAEADATVARLVVLPFENYGDPQNQYFTDGITEEITNRLGTLDRLGVIGRTSANQYRDTDRSIQEIAEELDVDHVVEGSVRWGAPSDGERSLRVSASLVRASDGTQIWQQDYDEVLTSGVFEVQSSIAQQVVEGLGLELMPGERERIASIPTDDPEAYDLYLRGNDHYRRSWARSDVETALDLYARATERDPEFALAFAALGWTHVWMHQLRYDPTPDRLRASLAAIDSALALDARLPEAQLALGLYYYWGHDDYERAVEHLERARQLSPSNPRVTLNLANILRRKGEFEEAIERYRRVAELDPRSPTPWFNLGETYLFIRRFDEAEPGLRRAISLAPDFGEAYLQLARVVIGRDRDREALREVLREAEEEIGATRWRASPIQFFRIVESPAELLSRLEPGRYGLDSATYHAMKAGSLTRLGRQGEALAHWDSARVDLERMLSEHGDLHWVHATLALAHAGLGQDEEALEHARRGAELLPITRDALDGPSHVANLAQVHVMLGDREAAVEQLERALSMPSWLSRGTLAMDPLWDPLRDHPGFRALVAEGELVALTAGRRLGGAVADAPLPLR